LYLRTKRYKIGRMARPIEIDRDEAFSAASKLFWRRGYKSTSLQQLLDTMNIGKSSFYAAFESKEALFSAVLAQYSLDSKALFSEARLQKAGLNAIRAFLNTTFVDVTHQVRLQGCLAVNSTLELADVDQTLHRQASQILAVVEAEILCLLIEAQTLGQIHRNQSAQELAPLLMLMIQGLRVSSRRGMTRKQAAAAVDALLELMVAANR